ncbi:hypothetical protein BU25DRAFT_425642 [Macroventuria anomochaeta]|uniref:Uncharacterized protein n=1 Tax=Macroventuria anomochaeta TaxID=301207 RepID=A0ACB6RKS2_9PLEO|nr:uncharacterized protein BU25DRAFT_425642 [Macroventuria anomochaeta]KAF2622471.1 hypothetical protein BU25DRAFT_425642 [Macroventuria anomochaeta]
MPSNTSHKRTAVEAFPGLLALPSFEPNQNRDEGETHFDRTEEYEENNKDYDDTSQLRFLLDDDIEEDSGYEDNSDYGYESANEGDEDYDIEVPIGFGDALSIREDVLRSSSKFFDTALRERWKEGAFGSINLPEVDTEGFATYAKWVYTGHLYLRGTVDEVLPKRNQVPGPIKTLEWRHWLTCYQTGEYLQDADFRGALVDAVVQLYNRSIAKKKNNSLFFASAEFDRLSGLMKPLLTSARRKSWAYKHSYCCVTEKFVLHEPQLISKVCSEIIQRDDKYCFHAYFFRVLTTLNAPPAQLQKFFLVEDNISITQGSPAYEPTSLEVTTSKDTSLS